MACPSGGFILPPAQRDLGFREFLVSQGPGVLPGRNLRGTERCCPSRFEIPTEIRRCLKRYVAPRSFPCPFPASRLTHVEA